MQGEVPTPSGNIKVYCSKEEIKVTGAAGIGTLRFKSSIKPECKAGILTSLENNSYELNIEKGKEYIVMYKEK